jgi:hypothetical protein
MYDLVLKLGAYSISTQKWGGSVPFAYNQYLKENDDRELISCKGDRFVKLKHYQPGGASKKVTMVSYREGRGKNFVLMASTTNREIE